MDLCLLCTEKCNEADRQECIDLDYAWWSPKDSSLCTGCQMCMGSQCCRHAEPCLKKAVLTEMVSYSGT